MVPMHNYINVYDNINLRLYGCTLLVRTLFCLWHSECFGESVISFKS